MRLNAIKFAPIPVVVLTIILYAAVFASVASSDELADVPKRVTGLNLDRGYDALSKVRRRSGLRIPPRTILSMDARVLHEQHMFCVSLKATVLHGLLF